MSSSTSDSLSSLITKEIFFSLFPLPIISSFILWSSPQKCKIIISKYIANPIAAKKLLINPRIYLHKVFSFSFEKNFPSKIKVNIGKINFGIILLIE